MKTINFTKSFSSLREAIENSGQAYGLEAYSTSELAMREQVLSDVKTFFLTDTGDIIYFYSSEKSVIVHKFSWIGCLHNGAAAIVELIRQPDIHEKLMKGQSISREEAEAWMNNPVGIIISEYKYHRDSLRKTHLFWTIDSL